jgi:hypothetical protein
LSHTSLTTGPFQQVTVPGCDVNSAQILTV